MNRAKVMVVGLDPAATRAAAAAMRHEGFAVTITPNLEHKIEPLPAVPKEIDVHENFGVIWGGPEDDPVASIKDLFAAIAGDTSPNQLVMQERSWLRIARSMMGKRAFRRYRARLREARRATQA